MRRIYVSTRPSDFAPLKMLMPYLATACAPSVEKTWRVDALVGAADLLAAFDVVAVRPSHNQYWYISATPAFPMLMEWSALSVSSVRPAAVP